eukprot:Tbor_TRINITY_DN2229_c0_g1::TRINITY_DN2229_c0_g1_i1::g.2741::m.2741/K19757/RSPH9; radial spoke head protein 9
MEYECLGLIGKSFSVPEKTAVKCSLLLLGGKLHTKVQLWGKVCGIHGDYLIAQTVPESPEEKNISFYSTDGGTNWLVLPDNCTPDQIAFCEEIRGRFMGKADFEYKIRKDIPPEVEDVKSIVTKVDDETTEGQNDIEHEKDEEHGEEEEEEEEHHEEEEVEDDDDPDLLRRRKNKPKFQILSLSESRRLSLFVKDHDEACKLIVRGSYIWNEKTQKLTKNRTFEGLEVEQASKLRNFLKLSSNPKTLAEKAAAIALAAPVADSEVLEGAAVADEVNPEVILKEETRRIYENNKKWFGPTYNAATDFLSPITEDCPEGVWCCKYDPSMGVVFVQNLYFMGSLFWYAPNTDKWGQMYYGLGERNLDLVFQLPGKLLN